MEFTIDELTALTLTHGRAANHARKAAELLLKVADENDNLAQIYLEAGKRIGRETEAKESKVKLRSIITSVLVLVLMCVFLMGSLTLAQDVTPEQTVVVTATVNGNPVEATLEPVGQPANGDTSTSTLNTVLDKVIIIIAILGVVLLAFKTAGLVPKETALAFADKGFVFAKELTGLTQTPLDDTFVDLAKPGLLKWLNDELDKRAGVVTVNVQNPAPEISGAGAIADALRRGGSSADGK